MTEPVYTVKDAYGKPLSELTAPEGWEFTGEFKIPKWEYWLTLDGCMAGKNTYPQNGPRLILHKARLKRIIFEEIATIKEGERYNMQGWQKGVTVGVTGENYMVPVDPRWIAPYGGVTIYSRREEEF